LRLCTFAAPQRNPSGASVLRVREFAQGLPVPRMRYARNRANPRACRERQARRGCDLCERERIEPRRDLVLEPGLVALAGMLARSGAYLVVRAPLVRHRKLPCLERYRGGFRLKVERVIVEWLWRI
jgi:hypothetical protein